MLLWKKVHLVGIKGVGMTGLAQILQARGIKVTGSDVTEHFFTDEVLKRQGIKVSQGFSASNVPTNASAVIYSTAYHENNVEIQETKNRGISLVSYPEALGMLMENQKGVAVCGSHGKTTTTAMLGMIFREAGLDPTVLVGSEVPQFGGNAVAGQGPHVIVEADEYQNKFQYYHPEALIITSIDWDHPDFFPTAESYQKAFEDFLARVPQNGVIVACGEDENVLRALKRVKAEVVLYGFADKGSAVRGLGAQKDALSGPGVAAGAFISAALVPPQFFEKTGAGHHARAASDELFLAPNPRALQTFSITLSSSRGDEVRELGEFSLQIPGRHNVLNSLAVIGMALHYHIPLEIIKKSLVRFQGTKRRLEFKGVVRPNPRYPLQSASFLVYDDYAHTPREIQTTLAALRELHPKTRIIAVFQPHTFSRTKAFLQEFAQSFFNADEVILLPVYASARETVGEVTSEDLFRETQRHHSRVNLCHSFQEVVDCLLQNSNHLNGLNSPNNPSLLITLGAGDVWRVGEELLK
jgi:UDP-N-acetylmuramate--alanine ligase